MSDDNETVLNKQALEEIFVALKSQGRAGRCALINKMISEILHLRSVVTQVKDKMKHPDDAYEQAFGVYDLLQTEVDSWESEYLDRLKVELARG